MSKSKYQREKQQYSLDGGITWQDVTPPNYRTGRLLEADSPDCNVEPIYSSEYLTTEFIQSGSIKLSGGALTNIYYSVNDGQWIAYNGSTYINANAGDKIRWKSDGYSFATNVYTNFYFTNTDDVYNPVSVVSNFYSNGGTFKAYGNAKSLIYSDNFTSVDETNINVGLPYLFKNTNITDAENLILPSNIDIDARHRDYGALSDLFYNCRFLTKAPVLPATTITYYAYENMFYGCTSLTTAPVLPATTLALHCYTFMFRGCTSLVNAPSLPATTLEDMCYEGMFIDCTSLTTAPALPATTLAMACYNAMFSGCTSLVTAPQLPATTLDAYCYSGMFDYCTSLTTAPALPATTLRGGCYSYMFQGCTSLTTAPALPATTLKNECYNSMFNRCTSLINAPDLPATTLPSGLDGQYCYNYMFTNCRNLKRINCQLSSIDYGTNYPVTYHWVDGVPTSGGTFIYNCANTQWQSGENGYPSNWTRSCT